MKDQSKDKAQGQKSGNFPSQKGGSIDKSSNKNFDLPQQHGQKTGQQPAGKKLPDGGRK